jgi:ribosomal protein S18 acetylase RimI-like enzyme
MTLRPATTADVDFFFALHKQALGPYVDAVWGWDDDVQRAYLHRTLDLTRARVIVADGVDVGRLDVEEHPDEVFLALIELTAEHQSHGIGRLLIQMLLADASANGKRVRLSVLEVNVRAYQLYRRLGFVEVSREGVAPEVRVKMVAQP